MNTCRVLARRHYSAEDLTVLAKARRERSEERGVDEGLQSKTISSWTMGSDSVATGRKTSPKSEIRSEMGSSADGKILMKFIFYYQASTLAD